MIELIHGDCLVELPKLGLDPQRCVILTDPPYGVNHDTDYTRFSGGSSEQHRHRHRHIENDNAPFDPSHLLGFERVVLWGSNNYSDRLPRGSLFIWDKRTPNGNKNVMSDGEAAWYSRGNGVYIFQHTWDGFNRASERRTAYHPAQKPVAVMAWCIEKMRIPEGFTIVDPYFGSGPVALAADDAGFDFIGIEIDRAYFEIAQRRIAEAQLQPRLPEIDKEPAPPPEQLPMAL